MTKKDNQDTPVEVIKLRIEAKIESEEKGRAEGRAEERAKARSNVLEKIKTLISKRFDTEILVETFHVTGEERQIFAI